jgi:hypothetical protein
MSPSLEGNTVLGADRLQDCGLAFALPLSRDAFLDDYENPSKDFVRNWVMQFEGLSLNRLWLGYSALADYARLVAAEAEALGVRVLTEVTLKSWAALTLARPITTLVAHWAESGLHGVEFSSGIVQLDEVCAALPGEYRGVLDLTICHSSQAIAPLKRARPQCTVLANREAARLDIRLAMYRQIVRILNHERINYVDAAARVHMAGLEVR